MDQRQPSPPAQRANVHLALVGAAACWTGFLIIALLVQIGVTQGFDRNCLLFWRHGTDGLPWGPSWLPDYVRAFTALGGVFARNIIAIAVAAALLASRRKNEAAQFAITVASAWMVDWLLKITVARPRPEIVPHLISATGMSFPSGHSFNAAAIYIAMALAFRVTPFRPGLRIALIGAAAILAALIALSRVWLGVHNPTDAIAGWLGGAGWALLAHALFNRQPRGH